MMPIVQSLEVKPIPWKTVNSTNKTSSDAAFDYSKLVDFGFKSNHKEPVYTLYGVRYKEIVRVDFTYDENNMWMDQNVTIESYTNFNGTFMRVAVTEDFFIVSNSNGVPGVSFFDHDLKLV